MIRIVKEGRRVGADGQFMPPPCICPDPRCQHCNPDPPFCPLLIDYPVDAPPAPRD